MGFDQLGRTVILTIAQNKAVTSFVRKYGMKLGAKQFVAGETLNQVVEKVKEMNKEGLLVTLDHLGEGITTKEEAIAATEAAVEIVKGIAKHKLNSNISVKLTQLGLDIDKQFCLENVDRIAQEAKNNNNFLRIDIEDSPRIDATIEIFNTLLERYGNKHVGLVLQAYLYRTEKDLIELGKKGVSLRIVKGAYKEPKEVAFPLKKDVDTNYVKLVKMHLLNGNYTAAATHDEKIINELKDFVRQNKIGPELFEFQMLYGIRNELQRQLVKEGFKVRVYTGFGEDWYPYYSRRIAERPANMFFILKNLLKK